MWSRRSLNPGVRIRGHELAVRVQPVDDLREPFDLPRAQRVFDNQVARTLELRALLGLMTCCRQLGSIGVAVPRQPMRRRSLRVRTRMTVHAELAGRQKTRSAQTERRLAALSVAVPVVDTPSLSRQL